MKNLTDESKANHLKGINFQIAQLRKKMGLNQIEFAKRAGVGLRFLRELERGKLSVRLDKLLQVLDFLGCHLELKSNHEDINNWLSDLTSNLINAKTISTDLPGKPSDDQ